MHDRHPSLYHRHRFPPEIIAEAVWLYFRFPLSFSMVEDMLAYRGIIITHTTRTAPSKGKIEAAGPKPERPETIMGILTAPTIRRGPCLSYQMPARGTAIRKLIVRAVSERPNSVELIVPSIATRLSTNGNAHVASPEAVFPIHSRRKGKDNVFRGRASISDIAHFGINDA